MSDGRTIRGTEKTADPAIEELRLRIFRLLLLIAVASLLVVGIRGTFSQDGRPVPDYIVAALMLFSYLALAKRPAWRSALSWFFFALLWGDVCDGLVHSVRWPITPTHILLPLLVLYGSILGNLAMTATSLVIVLFIYLYTGVRHPLSPAELSALLNLAVVTGSAGIMSLAVWTYFQTLARRIRHQAAALARELEENVRLNAIIFHDIANPLHAVLGPIEIAQTQGVQLTPDEIGRMDRMLKRIKGIIETVRDFHNCDRAVVAKTKISVGEIFRCLTEMFSRRLGEKNQTFVLTSPADVTVECDSDPFCSSVMGNLLSNAIKFSPRGARIELFAEAGAGTVKIALRNPGKIPNKVLAAIESGRAYGSSPGTEGESGFGYGLKIAARYLCRMGGDLKASNDGDRARFDATLPRS